MDRIKLLLEWRSFRGKPGFQMAVIATTLAAPPIFLVALAHESELPQSQELDDESLDDESQDDELSDDPQS